MRNAVQRGCASRITEGNMKNRTSYFTMLALAACSLFGGCAEKGPIPIDMRYISPAGMASPARKITVGVSAFKDERTKPLMVLGKRVYSDGQTDDFITTGTVAELVAAKLKDALTSRGITVKDVAGWDMTPEGIKPEGVDVLFGGEIKMLWVESESAVLNTKLVSEVKLRVAVADVKEKKIFRTLTLTSKLERTDFSFSLETVEDTLSHALSSAIDQLMNDEELKKKIP